MNNSDNLDKSDKLNNFDNKECNICCNIKKVYLQLSCCKQDLCINCLVNINKTNICPFCRTILNYDNENYTSVATLTQGPMNQSPLTQEPLTQETLTQEPLTQEPLIPKKLPLFETPIKTNVYNYYNTNYIKRDKHNKYNKSSKKASMKRAVKKKSSMKRSAKNSYYTNNKSKKSSYERY